MPTIKKPNQYFDATLYAGNSTSVTVTNAGVFQPDLIWIKDRTSIAQHVLTDSVRGTSAQLFSSLTNAEQTNSTYVTSFNSNGFTVGVGNAGTGVVNNSGDNFVGWQWKAGGASTVNTNGSISSNVSVNTTAGFSVATYTGNGSAGATIGHGLGAAPKFIIIKKRSSTADWDVYHSSLGATKALYLNRTDGQQTGTTFWNDTAPSATLTTFGTSPDINSNGVTYVMYSWAEVEGFSKFGSYAGNSSTDGPFVYTGFKPRWILIKKYAGGTASNWHLHDTARDTYNSSNSILIPDSSGSESVSSGFAIDMLSNGFKLRTSDGSTNGSTLSYIYAAFAESPFKYSNAS